MIESKNNLTVGRFVREMQSVLSPRYGDGEAKAMTRLIFHSLKGWSATDLVINSDQPVSDYIVGKVDEILKRLGKGEPIQYILGEARFYGMDLKVDRSVLIPRPETEELVDIICKENKESDLRVLDIGTGSGAIAIALSRNLLFPTVTAIDISADALAVARANAKRLYANIDFIRQDVFTYEPSEKSFDIIVSNPPYVAESEKAQMDVNVLEYEPSTALFVPDDNPLVYYSRIAEIGQKALDAGGRLYFEINPLFADDLVRMLEADHYRDVEIFKDISQRSRFAKAIKS